LHFPARIKLICRVFLWKQNQTFAGTRQPGDCLFLPRSKTCTVCITWLACLASAHGEIVIVAPVNAGRASDGEVIAGKAVVAGVVRAPRRATGLLFASLCGWLKLFAVRRSSARVKLSCLAKQPRLAFRRVVASISLFAFATWSANLDSAAWKQINCFAVIVRAKALGLSRSKKIALLSSMAARSVRLHANVGGEASVPGDFAVQPGVATSGVARLAQLAELRHVGLLADTGRPRSMVCVLAV